MVSKEIKREIFNDFFEKFLKWKSYVLSRVNFFFEEEHIECHGSWADGFVALGANKSDFDIAFVMNKALDLTARYDIECLQLHSLPDAPAHVVIQIIPPLSETTTRLHTIMQIINGKQYLCVKKIRELLKFRITERQCTNYSSPTEIFIPPTRSQNGRSACFTIQVNRSIDTVSKPIKEFINTVDNIFQHVRQTKDLRAGFLMLLKESDEFSHLCDSDDKLPTPNCLTLLNENIVELLFRELFDNLQHRYNYDRVVDIIIPLSKFLNVFIFTFATHWNENELFNQFQEYQLNSNAIQSQNIPYNFLKSFNASFSATIIKLGKIMHHMINKASLETQIPSFSLFAKANRINTAQCILNFLPQLRKKIQRLTFAALNANNRLQIFLLTLVLLKLCFQTVTKLMTYSDDLDTIFNKNIYTEMMRKRKDARFEMFDIVPCLKFNGWPAGAAEWVTRKRFWPESDVVNSIIQNGYHVVLKASFKGNEDLEGRLSFSKAEILLFTSFNTKQSVLFYLFKMLFYLKLNPLQILTSYHIKTVTMWVFEQCSEEFWQKESYVENGLNLLITNLYEALKKKVLKNYFVPGHNLLMTINEDEQYLAIDEVTKIRTNLFRYMDLVLEHLNSYFMYLPGLSYPDLREIFGSIPDIQRSLLKRFNIQALLK